MSRIKKRLYISLGFDVTNLLSGLLDRGFSNGDSLVLIVPKNRSERNEEAIKRIELLLSELGMRGCRISMDILELDEHSPLEALKVLISHIKEWDGDTYLDAVGGLRVLCVIMTIASILMPKKNVYLTSIAENSGKRVEIPQISLPSLISLSRAKLDVLKAVKRGNGNMEGLGKLLNKDKGTVSRHLMSLEEMGLIERIHMKPAEYVISGLGDIILLSLMS